MYLLYSFPPLRWLCAAFFLLSANVAFAQGNTPFKLHLDRYRGSIQWQQSLDRVTWTDVPNAQQADASLDPKQTTYYRAKITEAGCAPLYSDVKAAYVYGTIRVSAKLAQGQVLFPAGSTVKISDCTIRSLWDKGKLQPDGRFELLVADSTAEDLLILTGPNQKVLMLGTYYGSQPSYILNAQSTSLALLMMYPWLKPIPTARKGRLVQAYKGEPEFVTLTRHVESLIKKGGDLSEPANLDIAKTALLLVGKGFNNSRQRLASPTAFDPIDIEEEGNSTILVRNNTSYSYAVGIYRKRGNTLALAKKFMVAGSSLAESPYKTFIGEADAKTEVTYDFVKEEQGEYLIKIRSGLAKDGSAEDEAALDVNNRDLVISFFDNVFTNILGLRGVAKDIKDCVDAAVGAKASVLKLAFKQHVLTGAGVPTNQFLDIMIPVMGDIAGVIGGCNIAPDSKDFLSLAFKSTVWIKNVYDAAPTMRFFVEWPVRAKAVDGCKFVFVQGQQKKIVNCFTIVKNNRSSDPVSRTNNYVCDTVTAKVRLKEDPRYYPYRTAFEFPTVGVAVFWNVIAGGGALVSGTPALTGRLTTTDENGETQVAWKLGDKPGGPQEVTAQILNQDFTELKSVNIVSGAVVPTVAPYNTAGNGNKQTGPVSKPLPKPLVIFLRDVATNSPVFRRRFEVTWAQVKGTGKVELDESHSTDLFSAWTWTLGSEAGEQIVKATLVNKGCAPWNIAEKPIFFQATATDECLPANAPLMQLLTGGGTKTWLWTSYSINSSPIPNCSGPTIGGPALQFSSNGRATGINIGEVDDDGEECFYKPESSVRNGTFCLNDQRVVKITVQAGPDVGTTTYTILAISATAMTVQTFSDGQWETYRLVAQ
ncbi:hypothetical protein I2I05_21430 [Hymenobacter sp. BT683]|uniref:Uncharacterized protein n=1 Tax=Hymenobacter jeongseonensis TaxID=2791027 RepID=A0ABS0INP4_9BACT|nr:hypothetical protein [Hymenobacter jeongseonensis]MBF9239968.1 hypothetical protein [Hymenobacter jeongseonensis]